MCTPGATHVTENTSVPENRQMTNNLNLISKQKNSFSLLSLSRGLAGGDNERGGLGHAASCPQEGERPWSEPVEQEGEVGQGEPRIHATLASLPLPWVCLHL